MPKLPPPAKKSPKRRKFTPPKPYEPSDAHLSWYTDWINHSSLRQIAAKNGVTAGGIHHAVQKVCEWVKAKRYDTIIEFRERHIAALEVIAQQAWNAWQSSIRIARSVTQVDGVHSSTTTRTDEELGDPRYLSEYRAALADIRKIEGVDKSTKIEVTDSSGLPRVAGLERAEAIKLAAAAMLATANAIAGVSPNE